MHNNPWRERWLEAAPQAQAILEALAQLAPSLPDTARAEDDLRRYVGVVGAETAATWLLRDPERLGLLLRLSGVSRYAFDAVLKRPQGLRTVVESAQQREVWGRSRLASHLAALLAETEVEDEAISATLVRFKEHHYIRITLGDITGRMRFESVVAELSDLVDVLAEAALARARVLLAPKWGPGPLRFVILGMGKLGGRELNYSSDIDLIFLYQDVATEEWPAHEYAQKLGATLIRILDEPSSAGRLFRVDMRLRPEGDRGELALSLQETSDYYYSVGRSWERQAMIKARPIAGDLDLGKRLLDDLWPWIFPKDPQWDELDSTRAMRRRIEERRDTANLKTGAGGIRDIEFLVQFFQLSHGGRLSELRNRSTIPTLRVLGDVGIVDPDDVLELDAAYRFLRTVEHRLQMWEDRQLHELPSDAGERDLVARRCGFSGTDALARFDAKIAAVRERVRALADLHYLRDSRDQDAVLALLVQDEADAELIDTVLAQWPFRDRRQAAANLRRMAREPFFLLSRSRTEKALAALVPELLPMVAVSPDPDQTLANLARITEAVGGRATFYDLLLHNAGARRLICDLAGWATYLVNLLGEVPGLADEFVDSINQPLRSPVLLRQEAAALVAGIDDMVVPLRFFQARETLAAAVRDLEGLELAQVNHHLSNVAVATITATLTRCIERRAAEWGLPQIDGVPSRFCVLGLGKLGSRALSYTSDMDVIFVCDNGGVCADGVHDGENFWTRVAQDCMRILDDGKLYEIDPRLRPWGDQGSLVTAVGTLRQYWSEPRDLWERMAMVRMAPIAGDPILAAEAVRIARGGALAQDMPADAIFQVRDMRRRLEESVVGRDHVKRGWGGYVDHEFIAQYFSFGLPSADIPIGVSISELLDYLGTIGRIPAAAAEELRHGLIWLRFVEARSRLSAGKAVSSIPTDPEGRLALARRCQKDGIASFDLDMHHARARARHWFDILLPP